MFPEKASWAQ